MKRARESDPDEPEQPEALVSQDDEGIEEGEDLSQSDSDESDGSDDPDSYPDVSDSEGLDDDDEESEGGEEKEIVIDFEFFDPKESDFLGLKALLHSYLDGEQYDCSGLVDTIIKQNEVGTVVKTSEEDDPIAIMTVMNTVVHKGQAWLQSVEEFLVKHCSNEAIAKELRQVFKQQGTGLLINERLMNSPPKIAPPLLQFLFQEIQGAAQNKEATAEQRNAFKFSRYLIASRVYADEDPDQPCDGPSTSQANMQANKPSKKQKKGLAANPEPVIVYLRPEDEFLHQQSSWCFTFPIEGRPVGKDDLKPLRLVMLVDASKIPTARKALDAVVGNMASEAGL